LTKWLLFVFFFFGTD